MDRMSVRFRIFRRKRKFSITYDKSLLSKYYKRYKFRIIIPFDLFSSFIYIFVL